MEGRPLEGVRLVEMAGLGPAPFAGMVLADMGAEVTRVVRPGPRTLEVPEGPADILNRGKRSIVVDLKADGGRDDVLALLDGADGLFEGFRPGVMERLGLGPAECQSRNPRLVYGRMTGWGQDGPLAGAAGHDIGYIAVAGALRHFARAGERPVPPLNLVGDFGGGAMFLVAGMLAALLEAGRTGRGRVVDTAMVDCVPLLMAMTWSFVAAGTWDPEAIGGNILDTGAPFYDVYETADGAYVSVGTIEAGFYAEMLARLGIDAAAEGFSEQMDVTAWPRLRARLTEVFRTRTRAEWAAALEGTDACVAPVLSMTEAVRHPHLVHRGTFLVDGGVVQPAPAPRFS